MFYAVYDTDTGHLVSSGSSVAEELPKGLSVKRFPRLEGQPSLGWNPQTKDWDVPEAVPTVGGIELDPEEVPIVQAMVDAMRRERGRNR